MIRRFSRVLIIACAVALLPMTSVAVGEQGASAAVRHSAASSASPASAYQVQPQQPSTPSAVVGVGDYSGTPGESPTQLSAMKSASATAKATGRTVPVAALTTGSSTVSALPDGRLSLSQSVLPVRVRRGNGWVPVNPSLRLGLGGRLIPVALPEAVSLSDGGSGLLAVLGTGGRSLSLSWPARLPAPQVSGAQATYPDVPVPGADLVVTASVTGLSEVVVVQDAAAARNPALSSLRLGVAGDGVKVVQERDGALEALAPGGREVFSAQPPLMWDSSDGVAAGSRSQSTVQARTRSRAQPTVLRSSVAGPGTAARLAGAGMRLAGAELTIVPDKSMLLSPPAAFPIYIDPTWQTVSPAPVASHFDMVQEASPCDGVSYYDNENSDENPDSLGVGYFPSSFGSCYGTQNAYYTMPIPSAVDGATIDLATFNAAEDYSASCSTDHNVNLIETGSIGSTTDYEHQPTWYSSDLDVTQNGTGVPDTADGDINCDVGTLGPSSDSEPYGFTITSAVKTAAKSPYESSLTLVMTESSQDSSGDSLKRFTNNPNMTIEYDFAPNSPVNVEVGDNSSDMQACPSSGSLPQLGASSGSGVQLKAKYSQKNAENLTAYFQYWDVTKGQTDTTNAELSTTVAGSSSGTVSAPVTIPQATLNKMSDNDTVDVKTWSEDPADQTSSSVTCSFKVYPTASGDTKITESAGNVGTGQDISFTFAAATPADCKASTFEWALNAPPVSGAETQETAVNGTYTLTIIAGSPGPDQVDAYANCSNNVNPTTTGAATYSVNPDPALSCASWTAAMTDDCTNSAGTVVKENFDNSMLSGGSGSCGATAGDGGGRQINEAQLADQGWKPSGNVTVDGASFTLPAFGSCATDNVLAADQTITTGGQGSAMVFLATSTNSFAEMPSGSGEPGDQVFGSDTTAPPVGAGTQVSGTGCNQLTASAWSYVGCVPATGQINYSNGTSQTYYLSVPDWVSGPTDLAAVATVDRNLSTGALQVADPKIFAFSVPMDPALTVASVTLPDVSDTTTETGVTASVSSLHIFGMSVRNTAGATPEVNATSAPAPSSCGCAWTGAYESPIETGWAQSGGSGAQTIRLAVAMNTGAPVGSQLRIRLSNPGFLWNDGDGPIDIGDATVALQQSAGSPVPTATPVKLTFGGNPTATLCAGCDVYSDPLTLTAQDFAITAGQTLLVSLYVSNPSGSLPYLPGSQSPSGAEEWISAAGTDDQTGATSNADFPASALSDADSLLSGVDVTTSPDSAVTYQSTVGAGEPTVVVAGDNVTDNGGASVTVATDNAAPSIRLAGQLANSTPTGQTGPTAAGFGVVDAGIENNQVQASDSGAGGVSLLDRIDRDVLAEPGVGTVVIDEGLQDLLLGVAAGNGSSIGDAVTTAYGQLTNILNANGITIVYATLTPCAGYAG